MAPDGGSGESGRCAWIAGRVVGQESDGAIEPTSEGDVICGAMRQKLEFRLDGVGTDEHWAAGSAAAHAGMVLRLVVFASRASLAARRTVRQRERPIEGQCIGVGSRGKSGEQGLDHEQIGRENRDPASLL